jgi:hypothetical protein
MMVMTMMMMMLMIIIIKIMARNKEKGRDIERQLFNKFKDNGRNLMYLKRRDI